MGPWQFNYISIFYIAAFVISVISAYRSLKMQPVRGAREFSLLTASISIWVLGYLLNFYNTQLYWKLIFLRVEYFGIICSSYFWFIFIITYINYEPLLKRKFYIMLAVIPVLSYLLVITVNFHHWFYISFYTEKENGLVIFKKEYAAGFYILLIHIYFLVIVGGLMLLHSIQQMQTQFRKQMAPISAIIIIILVSNILYVLKINPFDPYDVTPISFVFIGLGFNFLSAKYDFLDVVPIAYNQVFRSVNSGIIIIDQREYIIEFNPYAEKILSISAEKAIGKPLKLVSPECSRLISEIKENKIKTELKLGKESKTYSIDISAINSSSSINAGRIIMLYDITELKNALDDLDTYAHTVAHDLKNPLGSLMGFSEILESEDVPEDLKMESVGIIRTTSTQLVQIVNGLLFLASVRRKEDIEINRIDTEQVIKRSLSRVEKLVNEKGGHIYYPDEWPDALGYEPWVEEVWTNYISNAFKYGGTPPEINVGADRVNGYVKFWVKDNGNGLSEEDQKNLFKEFNRLAYRADEPGHGLGLSIVKRILDKLNGDAGVESQVGQGSKFYFTLPACKD